MTDKQAVQQAHADAYVYKWGGWRDGEEGWTVALDRAEHSERLGSGTTEADAWSNARSKLQPEGATTQPTRFGQHHCDTYVKELGRICDRPATVNQGQMYRCDEHDPYALTPMPQPVPSAGSKPQEVEGNGSWPNPSLQRAFVEGMKWWQFHHNGATAFPSERDEAENEAVRRFGQPVADGGGLQEWESLKDAAEWSIRNNKGNWMRVDSEFDGYASPENILKLLAAYASSQEALRLAREENEREMRENIELMNGCSLWRNRAISAETSLAGMDRLESPIEAALRERMQRAAEKLKLVNGKGASPILLNRIIREAISLLSPEGSSR